MEIFTVGSSFVFSVLRRKEFIRTELWYAPFISIYIQIYIYIMFTNILYIYVCVYIYIYIYTTKMSRGKRVFFNVCFPDWLKVGGRNFYRNQSRFKFFYAELVLRLSETFFTKRWKKITYRISFFFQLTFFFGKIIL